MRKKASARIKNKVKALFARSIAQMERSVGKGRPLFQSRHHDKKKNH